MEYSSESKRKDILIHIMSIGEFWRPHYKWNKPLQEDKYSMIPLIGMNKFLVMDIGECCTAVWMYFLIAPDYTLKIVKMIHFVLYFLLQKKVYKHMNDGMNAGTMLPILFLRNMKLSSKKKRRNTLT